MPNMETQTPIVTAALGKYVKKSDPGTRTKIASIPQIDERLYNMKPLTPIVTAALGKYVKKSDPDTRTKIGRGIPQIDERFKTTCPCLRPKTIVFCRACGYYCHGRIRIPCEIHPRVTFLFDFAKCGRCYSSVYLDEFKKPHSS